MQFLCWDNSYGSVPIHLDEDFKVSASTCHPVASKQEAVIVPLFMSA